MRLVDVVTRPENSSKLIKEDRPVFAGADLRDLDGETGDYDQRNPLDNFMQGILDE